MQVPWELIKSLIGGAIGGGLVATGLWHWVGQVLLGKIVERDKAKYAREIEALKAKYAQELETYRAQLERSVFVTRAHFETEFQAYKEVFEGLSEVKLAMSRTRPMMRLGPQDETEEDRLKELRAALSALILAHDTTVNVVEHLIPFYPNDIYMKLNQCLAVARGEILDIRSGKNGRFSPAWYEDGHRRWDAFGTEFYSVTEAIRYRISILAILPR